MVLVVVCMPIVLLSLMANCFSFHLFRRPGQMNSAAASSALALIGADQITICTTTLYGLAEVFLLVWRYPSICQRPFLPFIRNLVTPLQAGSGLAALLLLTLLLAAHQSKSRIPSVSLLLATCYGLAIPIALLLTTGRTVYVLQPQPTAATRFCRFFADASLPPGSSTSDTNTAERVTGAKRVSPCYKPVWLRRVAIAHLSSSVSHRTDVFNFGKLRRSKRHRAKGSAAYHPPRCYQTRDLGHQDLFHAIYFLANSVLIALILRLFVLRQAQLTKTDRQDSRPQTLTHEHGELVEESLEPQLLPQPPPEHLLQDQEMMPNAQILQPPILPVLPSALSSTSSVSPSPEQTSREGEPTEETEETEDAEVETKKGGDELLGSVEKMFLLECGLTQLQSLGVFLLYLIPFLHGAKLLTHVIDVRNLSLAIFKSLNIVSVPGAGNRGFHSTGLTQLCLLLRNQLGLSGRSFRFQWTIGPQPLICDR